MIFFEFSKKTSFSETHTPTDGGLVVGRRRDRWGVWPFDAVVTLIGILHAQLENTTMSC